MKCSNGRISTRTVMYQIGNIVIKNKECEKKMGRDPTKLSSNGSVQVVSCRHSLLTKININV